MDKQLEANGPKAIGSSALEIAEWRGGVNAKLGMVADFAKDINNSVTELKTAVTLEIKGLNDKFNDIKYTVTKLVVWGGVALFVVNILVAIAVGVAIKLITKGVS